MGNNDDIFMSRYSAFNPYRMRHCELGYQTPIGAGDAMAKSLYCGMKPIASWLCDSTQSIPTGGIFNLEFSPEGSLLVAACEKKSIQIFDPLTHQRILSIVGAHMDCVNCVKFLDGRTFATCSDDTTIALWDVRNLKKKISSLIGHSKWVKNIEFSAKDKLLVTSGLDGSIFTWDINSYTESNLVYQRVFHTSSLMRCRLSPDARQMVMCTTGGLLVIVHDLNLSTLAEDLHGFKPNMYRLMQMSQQLLPIAAMYDHLFDADRKENRVEFISDFPDGNDAEVVSALQIHPQGWSALSRNISHDDRSEWSCIHDIQPLPSSNKSTRDVSPPPPAPAPTPGGGGRRGTPRRRGRPRARPYRLERPQPPRPPPPHDPDLPDEPEHAAREEEGHSSRESSEEREQPIPGPSRPRVALVAVERFRLRLGGRDNQNREAAGPSHGRGSIIVADAAASRRGRGIMNDVWEAAITIKQQRFVQETYSRTYGRQNFDLQRITGVSTGITPPPQPSNENPVVRPSAWGHSPRDSMSEENAATRHYIRQNKKRLLYYIEETNEGKGFIKELCYSADGRVVCSPFGRGMRLLALHSRCGELSHVQPLHDVGPPRAMLELGQSLGQHGDVVVSSRFSPRFHLLVTGCLEGKIVWYQPYSGEALY